MFQISSPKQVSAFALTAMLLSIGGCANGGGVNALPQLPIANVARPSFCPPILVISPDVGFPDRGHHQTLTDVLETRSGNPYGCLVVSKKHPEATWRKTGGSLEVIHGGRQSIFSSTEFGSFTVTARFGKNSGHATLVVQRDNVRVLATIPAQGRRSVVGSYGGLLLDSSGSLYGVTAGGGVYSQGSVYKLRPGASSVDTIYSFQGGRHDGAVPVGAMVLDSKGDLFGTTQQGGLGPSFDRGHGTVFELVPSKTGYAERLLYRFPGGKEGAAPSTGLTADPNGGLYGTTIDGKVFKLTSSGSSYAYSILYSFTIHQGSHSVENVSNLVIDNQGSLYGTYSGVIPGAVFKLARKGSSYVESTVYAFPEDSYPANGLVLDRQGVLYGTSTPGGAYGASVFKLVPHGDGFVEYAIHSFPCDCDPRLNGLTVGLSGVLYGTTQFGGAAALGTVFALAPNGAYRNLHTIEGATDGAWPIGSLVQDATGALYGVTQGGYGNDSTIYKILPNDGAAP